MKIFFSQSFSPTNNPSRIMTSTLCYIYFQLSTYHIELKTFHRKFIICLDKCLVSTFRWIVLVSVYKVRRIFQKQVLLTNYILMIYQLGIYTPKACKNFPSDSNYSQGQVFSEHLPMNSYGKCLQSSSDSPKASFGNKLHTYDILAGLLFY